MLILYGSAFLYLGKRKTALLYWRRLWINGESLFFGILFEQIIDDDIDILWFDFCCLDVSSTVLKSLVEIHITLTQEPVRECHIYDSFQLFLACRYQACAVTDEAEGVNDIPFDIIVMFLMRLYQYNRGTSFIHLVTQFSCKILFCLTGILLFGNIIFVYTKLNGRNEI